MLLPPAGIMVSHPCQQEDAHRKLGKNEQLLWNADAGTRNVTAISKQSLGAIWVPFGYFWGIARLDERFLTQKAGFRQKKASKSEDFKAFFWQGHKDLNPEPTVLETAALPIELYPYMMVGLRGLEPRTDRL